MQEFDLAFSTACWESKLVILVSLGNISLAYSSSIVRSSEVSMFFTDISDALDIFCEIPHNLLDKGQASE